MSARLLNLRMLQQQHASQKKERSHMEHTLEEKLHIRKNKEKELKEFIIKCFYTGIIVESNHSESPPKAETIEPK